MAKKKTLRIGCLLIVGAANLSSCGGAVGDVDCCTDADGCCEDGDGDGDGDGDIGSLGSGGTPGTPGMTGEIGLILRPSGGAPGTQFVGTGGVGNTGGYTGTGGAPGSGGVILGGFGGADDR